MQNEELHGLLQELPRYEAGETFTDSVMTAVSASESLPSPSRPRAWIAAAAALIAIAVGSGHFLFEQKKQAEIDAIAAQHRALEAEIAALREQASFDPVVEIGRDDEVRYILDLRPVDVQPVRTAALQPDFY